MRWEELARAILRQGVLGISQGTLTVARLLYKLEIHGLEHFPGKGPLIMVARHSSRTDIVGGTLFRSLLLKVQERAYGLTPIAILVNNRWVARLVRELGGLPAFKEKGLTAGPLMEVYNLLRQGKIIGVVPEGEIAWDGRLQPLKPGAAWLALRTGAPLMAAVLQGGYDIWPRWARRPRLTGKLIARFGKPFYICETPYERVTDEMIQEANRHIRAELERLSDGYLLRREETE